jgi:hypothetical protein
MPFKTVFSTHQAFREPCKRMMEECAKGRAGSRIIYYRYTDNLLESNQSLATPGYRLAYFRVLPLTTYAEKSPSHVVIIILPMDGPVTKEEEDKLISRHGMIPVAGSTVTSNNPKRRETLEYLESYDAELTRQLLAFQNHYTNPTPTAAPMGLTSLDLQTLGSVTGMTNPASSAMGGFNGYPSAGPAPLQKSFIHQNQSAVGGYGMNPVHTSEPQFSSFFSNIPSNLQSLPVVHAYAPTSADSDASSSHLGRGQVGFLQPMSNNPYLGVPAVVMNQFKAGAYPESSSSSSYAQNTFSDRSGPTKTSRAVYVQEQAPPQPLVQLMTGSATSPSSAAAGRGGYDDDGTNNLNEASTLLHLRNPYPTQMRQSAVEDDEPKPRKSLDGNTFASI